MDELFPKVSSCQLKTTGVTGDENVEMDRLSTLVLVDNYYI